MKRASKGPDAVAVVPAGGTGTRMGARQPKQYLRVGGVPLVVHALRALFRCPAIGGAVLAVPADRVAATARLLGRHGVGRLTSVVAGGAERQESVWRALSALPPGPSWVVVHDAVRPFIDREMVERVLDAARHTGAAICGLPIRETVKRVRGGAVDSTLDREGLWTVQTPQAFRRDLLWEAHDKARRDGFIGTDDAVLVERLGERVAVVAGLADNLKVTTPEDLRAARRRLVARTRGRARR